MEITKHVAFSKSKNPEFIKFLRDNNIPFSDTNPLVVSLDIYTSDPYWPEVEKFLFKRRLTCLTNMVFTDEELLHAEWMAIRTIWRTGDPQPINKFAYKDITYTKEQHCSNCGAGLKQIAPFRLLKTPSWGRRHFFAPYGLEDELFVDESVRRIFESNGITGVDFLKVYDKNGQRELLDIYQMKILHRLPEALVKDNAAISRVTLCPVCGREKMLASGGAKMCFSKSIFQNATDIVKSAEIFGGLKGIAANKMIINQKVYQVLKKNKLDRSLAFEPVDLVD